jgi:hypothetical protein
MQIDGDVDVLVALALELELAEDLFLYIGLVGALPLDLGEVVGLQALGAVEVDGDGAEVVGEVLGLGRRLGLAVLVHGVGVLVVLVVVFETLVALVVQQTALDLDAVRGIGVALEIECVGVDARALPRLVLDCVGDPYAHGAVARGARVVFRIHDVELFAHHGCVECALHLAQLLVAGHAVADADVLDALGNVLVGGVLCNAAHLFAALGFGALLGLHVGVVVLLGGRVLGRYNGAFVAVSKGEVGPADHGAGAGAGGLAVGVIGADAVSTGNGDLADVPGPLRAAGMAICCCGT